MTDFRALFYQELEGRNPEQQQAIQTIEGPVMVIAGPGTGKTDVLGLRIGYILEQTQTAIHNVLCLTYTEAGAMEMRRRLTRYIGPTAYNGQIFTFHGFCNMVIHEHLDRFGVYRDAQPASDLEQFQILREIIDEQPLEHPLKRFTGKIYYETTRLKKLFEVMKLERWTPGMMRDTIERWIETKRTNGEYIYQKSGKSRSGSYHKGDLKEARFQKEVLAPMEVLRAAVDCFDRYNEKLREAGRYDYHDMLTWVHDAFAEDPDLLASYQERFQYLLVDEFQDSNGIQLAILRLLASHWDRPDVFIVGDDDQSIFRFQGANMQNITAFKQEYAPEVIVLTRNYRSSQQILDAASALIANNTERLVRQFPEYTKDLTAEGPAAASQVMPEIHVYPNWTQEQAALLSELTALHAAGTLERESVAVIYRTHRQVEELLHVLEVRDIPINVKKPVNILWRPLIRNILTMMRYVAMESRQLDAGEHLLFEMMHYGFFAIPPRDAGKIAIACKRRRGESNTPWLEVMADEKLLQHLGIREVEAVLALEQLLTTWIRELKHLTIQELLEQILTRGGVLQWIFDHPNQTWHLQLVKTLFDHVKQETLRTPGLELIDFLERIDLMVDNNIELPVHKTLSAKDGIHFVTAHSAKGMQFDRVFIIGCTKRNWDEAGKGYFDMYKLPDLVPSSAEGSDEDERRLFYVAMTRARTHLTMSYHELDDYEREMEASRFINEITDAGQIAAQPKDLTDEAYTAYCADLFRPVEVVTPLVDHALIDQALDGFELSASALNKYLECPRKFYFDYVLRIPSAQKTYFGFGKAIHKTLDDFFTWHIRDGQLSGTADDLVNLYRRQLRRHRSHFTDTEYDMHLHFGEQILRSYFTQRADGWTHALDSLTEYEVRNAEHRGIPLKGDIDRVDLFKDHAVFTDYKTGKSSNAHRRGQLRRPDERNPHGGDYWRQIVFYQILLDADPGIRHSVDHGYIDFVQPRSSGEHERIKVQITPEDIQLVSDQIAEVWERIQKHDFEQGCGNDDCYWCTLVENEMTVKRDEPLPVQEEF
ncbi:MAG: ATP-dependent DNA helicase [Saprospiraceae bacterium]|nr:ATP-dependent DNA helicase [Saprospiraceae bacterium]